MKQLLTALEAVRNTAKDLHYAASDCPSAFYSVHLLADRIAEPCADFIDSLKEVCFLGNERDVPSSRELSEAVTPLLSTDLSQAALIASLYDRLKITLYTIEEISKQHLMQGEINLLGTIAEHLQQSRGLLWRQTIKTAGAE